MEELNVLSYSRKPLPSRKADEEAELQDDRDKRNVVRKVMDKTQKSLSEHQTFTSLESDLQQ